MNSHLNTDKALLIIVCVFTAIIKDNMISNYLLSASLIYVVVILILDAIVSKHYSLLIMALFMGTYCIIPIPFLLWNDHIIDNVLEVETTSTVYNAAVCLLMFMTTLYYFIGVRKKIKIVHENIFLSYSNNTGYIFSIVVALFCISYGLAGDNIFQTGGYGTGGSTRSSLFEYGMLPLTSGLIFSQKKMQKYAIYALCVFFVLKDILFGGRVSSVILIISVFLINFQQRFSTIQLIAFIFLGYTFFTIWGIFRADTTGNIAAVEFVEDGNARFVYYAAMRIHYMIEHGVLNLQTRLESFAYFLSSTVVPFEFLPKTANLTSYMQDRYYSGGGGLVSTFFYAWLSYPGIILVGWFVAKVLNRMYHQNCSSYLRYYAILMVASVPRWFAYYPIPLFKLCLYGVILIWAFNRFPNKRVFTRK